MDLIDRKALIKEVNENKELFESERVYLEGLLLNAPTVEYPFYQEAYQTGYEEGKNDRPHGKWITYDVLHCLQYCSECRVDFDYKWNFCPNCGADMREANDET